MSSDTRPQTHQALALDPWAALFRQRSKEELASSFAQAQEQDEGNVRSSEMTAKLRPNASLLCDAVARNNTQLVKDLLQGGFSVSARDDDGNTPLHVAAEHGLADLIKMLVAAGADIEAHGGDMDATALHVAAASGKTAAAMVLLDLGADVNAVGAYGTTALEIAARNNDVRLMMALIRKGAAVDSRSDNGWTPLHAATGFNNPMAISVLIRYGADANSRDVDGDTPLITACSMGHLDCVQQLLAGGANPRILAAVSVTHLPSINRQTSSCHRTGTRHCIWHASWGSRTLRHF